MSDCTPPSTLRPSSLHPCSATLSSVLYSPPRPLLYLLSPRPMVRGDLLCWQRPQCTPQNVPSQGPLTSTQSPCEAPWAPHPARRAQERSKHRTGALHVRDRGKTRASTHTLSHTRACVPKPRRLCTPSGQCSQQLHVFRALLIGPPPCPPPRPLGGKQEGGREGRLPQGGPPGLPAAPPTPGRTPRSTSAAGSGGSGPQ